MVLIYGRRKAMGGNCDEAARCGWVSWLGWRLVPCFLISLAIHCAFFILLDAGTEFHAITAVADQVGRMTRLQVNFALRGESVVAHQGATAAPVERRIAVQAIDKPQGGSLPPVQNDAAPELASEVSTEIDDFRGAGFMILALEINDRGVPGNAEVIYSDLPTETGELLVKRFTAARFRPAVKGGHVVTASILMRIDVE